LKTKPRPAHRLLGRCLSGALGRTLAKSDLPATETEWRNTLRRSCAHLVTPALRWALREQGYTSDLPADVLEFIDAVYALNLEGNGRYEDQLAHLIWSLNSVGVRPVLLKGAAALVGGLYPTSGDRMIGDIDVLIPVPMLSQVFDKLTSLGYRVQPARDGSPLDLDTEGFETRNYQYPSIDSPDWPTKVELHVHAVPLPFIKLLHSAEIFREATPFSWRGGECLLPSPTHFILHNVIHAFLQDFKGGTIAATPLSQRQLFEFVHAAGTYGERVDWNTVRSRFDASGFRNALRQYIGFSNAYFRFNAPPEIDMGPWNKFRVEAYLFRLDLCHPAIEFAFALLAQIRLRIFNLRKNPRNIKKLLLITFYSRLYSMLMQTKKSNTI
jgi:hypothetical protein